LREDGGVIDVRRAAERFTTSTDRLTSRHSFSFGAHYDPANVAHSVLVAHNDDLLLPGAGYATHPHADLEIVTWVLEGSLVHEDSAGTRGVIRPGLAQRLSAGSGVQHSERNDAPGTDTPTRFVQMWLQPDEPGLRPSYAQGDVSGLLAEGELVPLVSGVPGLDAPVSINTRGAALHVARLAEGRTVLLPDAPRLHLFVARGPVLLEDAGRLGDGDTARFTGDGSRRLTGAGPAEALVWQLP
jgi:quercetin 2,3-dioxygenase